MKREIPGWLYVFLAIFAILCGAARTTLIGKVSWLMHDSSGEAFLNFACLALTMGGFGTYLKAPKDPPDPK